MRNQKQKVRISDVFYNVIKGKHIVILMTIVGLITGILLSVLGYIRGEMTKQYKITSSVAISAQTDSGSFASRFRTPNKEDFNLAGDMTDASIYVMTSDRVIREAISQMGLVGVSASNVRDNLSLVQYNETQIIEISLMWRSEVEGIKIIETLVNVSNEVLIKTLKIGNLSIINQPTASYIFGGSIEITVLVYSTVIGFLIGVFICVIKLLMAPKLLRSKDMESLFGIELMGSIAYNVDYGESSPFGNFPENEKNEIWSVTHVLVNRMDQAEINRIYFTSTGYGEGKTRLIADIGAKISELGKKVLLVDCDFKNPTLSSMFDVRPNYDNSLNALYRGDCDKSDALIRLSGCLYLLPSILDKEAEKMSQPMFEMLDEIFSDFDYILIDAASIGVDSEVIMLNEISDAALFVVRFDDPELSDIRSALLRISKSGLPVAGCVVNGTKTWKNVVRDIEKISGRRKRKKNKKKA